MAALKFVSVFVFALWVSGGAASHYPAVTQVTLPVDHSEGPTWDPRNNMLYWVDLGNGKVLSYNYNTTETHSISFNGDVTPVITSKNKTNLFVVGLNLSVVAFEWDGRNSVTKQKVLTSVPTKSAHSRFNDGKADKQGRLWFGTMGEDATGVPPNAGVLYKITKSNVTVELSPVNISNGLAWNKANNKFYYIDSPTLKVVEYKYDDARGNISNPRVAFNLKNYPQLTGVPDGMTIDADDNLWVALYGGGAILHVNPSTGKLLQVVPIPARDVTSAMWGGPNLDILFVTTSRRDLTADQQKYYPGAGSVFAVTGLGTKGLPVFNADIVGSI